MIFRMHVAVLLAFLSVEGNAESPQLTQPGFAAQPAEEVISVGAGQSSQNAVNGKAESAPQQMPQIQPPRQEVKPAILPHRATYEISLYKNHGDDNIADAKGEMTLQVVHTGEGWAIEQKSTLHVYNKDGSAEQIRNTLTTWESADGLTYSFKVRTVRGDDEEIIGGDAFIPTKGGAGLVTYQQPEESTVQLPIGTVFPMQHMISMLSAAMRGQPIVSHIVFDGSSETHEPVQVDTALGKTQDSKLAVTNKDLLQAKKVWPMSMAIYAEGSTDPEANYKIVQHVLDQGVIRDMTIDYGAFEVKAVLTQVEVFQEPSEEPKKQPNAAAPAA